VRVRDASLAVKLVKMGMATYELETTAAPMKRVSWWLFITSSVNQRANRFLRLHKIPEIWGTF
jgi:hypothetical protein